MAYEGGFAGVRRRLVSLGWLCAGVGCSFLAPSDDELSASWGKTDASVAACTPGTKRCGSACVSTESPSVGCGSADCAPCQYEHGSALCIGGACALGPCESGYADCNNRSSDGCETDTRVSTEFCGSCGVSCGGVTPLCDEGTCVAKCHAVKFTSALARLHFPWNGPELLESDFTFELWFARHEDFVENGAPGLLYTNGSSPEPHIALVWIIDPGSLVFKAYSYNTGPVTRQLWAQHAPVPSAGRYVHLAGVREGATALLFLDGALVATSTVGTLAHTTKADVALGKPNPNEPWDTAPPIYLGPTRISRVARYSAPFRPKWRWNVDEHTVVQFLTHTAFDGVKLTDESGNGSHAVHDRDVIAAEQFTPCLKK